MGKKQKTKKGRPTENRAAGKSVKIETAVIIALVALVAGFFAGEIIDLSKPSRAPVAMQTPLPAQPPAQMPSQMPAQMPSFTAQQSQRILELEKEVAENPGKAEAWAELGHLYFDGNDAKQAIRAYQKALDLNPYDADVWTDLGVMYRRTKQPFEALAAFNKAADIDPRHEQSRFNKGVVLMHDLEDREGAIKAWEELLAFNPSARTSSGQSIKELVESLKNPRPSDPQNTP
jgi:cytochrome c-type biogenesis protein CcmH/NrfG